MDLSATIHLLGETLGAVLREQESAPIFETEERIRAFAKARRAGEAAAAPATAISAIPRHRPGRDRTTAGGATLASVHNKLISYVADALCHWTKVLPRVAPSW